ncbi:MAG: 16S rRNA (adenine(1518)-N(6)/adenine(1519)-N(6))-dimethyltransferase RsmA [Proteobacteria bacterium]|nr:16S rRNA (adenine(1518)-N(6)/adenine(1519)-N(6))-dimethyltransferase RsmA [Pseudomonadota bacterium]
MSSHPVDNPGTDACFRDPRRVLERYGLTPKRRFSQNFLISRPVHQAIAGAVAPEPHETVVELGAGLGTLTRFLLATGAHVIAVERDRDMLHVLGQELEGHQRLRLVREDAATLDFAALTSPLDHKPCVVGNLPYAIGGAILRNLVANSRHVSRCAVMLQREVGDRLLAEPGTPSYGALTVFIGAAYSVRSVRLVRPGAFFPRPQVGSALVSLTPHETPRALETEAFRLVVRAAFSSRRKILRNSLLRLPGGERQLVDGVLSAAGLSGEQRGETLSVEQFADLASAWDRHQG